MALSSCYINDVLSEGFLGDQTTPAGHLSARIDVGFGGRSSSKRSIPTPRRRSGFLGTALPG